MEIAGLATSCNQLFREICELCNTHNIEDYPEEPSIEREYGRFSLWARNIAALQNAQLPSSLGYRLRHDEKAQKLVVDELKYLEESLHLSLPIVSGQESNETWDTRDEVDSSQSVTYDDNVAYDELSSASLQDSELHQLFIAIQGAVTQLFRLSMMIRKKPKKDDYARAVDTVLMDPISDINHVKDKHPILREGRLWLAERLGRAITSCRQYFIYRRDHQEKLTAVHHLRTDEDGNTLWSGTRASTYYNDELPGNFVGTQYLPPQHPARTTATTEYADSSKGTEGSTTSFKTPPLPLNPTGVRYKFGDHFECPYCWRPQEIKSKTEWKKHVFSDLRPYVCTFESCNHDKFESQNEWFKHELNNHRKQWSCILCEDQDLQTLESLGTHFSILHADLDTQPHTEIMAECLQPRISALDCPLCNTYGENFQRSNESRKCDVSLKQFQQHLGRHMEQLALCAWPTDEGESGNLTTYDVYSIRKVQPVENEKSTWAKANITKEPLTQDDIAVILKKLQASSQSISDKKAALSPFQQTQVNNLLDKLNNEEIDHANFTWSLSQIDRREETINNVRETDVISVTVRRGRREDVEAGGIYTALDRDPHIGAAGPVPP